MNEKQRQLVLLIWLMVTLSIVLVFLLKYAPQSPLNGGTEIANNATNYNPAPNKNMTRSFQPPGIVGEAFSGLTEMWKDIQSFGQMSG